MCATIDAVWGLRAEHIWLAIVIGHFTRASLSVFRFRQGKWRGIEVSIEPSPG
jgi:Na+-driven multidrug efflux pump